MQNTLITNRISPTHSLKVGNSDKKIIESKTTWGSIVLLMREISTALSLIIALFHIVKAKAVFINPNQII